MYIKNNYKKTIILSTLLMLLSFSVFAQEAPVVGQSGNPFAKAPPPVPKNNQQQHVNQPLTPEQEEAVRQIVLNLSPNIINQSTSEFTDQLSKDPHILYLEKNESIRGTLNGHYMIFNSVTNDYRYELISKYKSVYLYETTEDIDSKKQDLQTKNNKKG